ncbi:MAG: hypothetical protein ACRDVW_06865 [Acidimicrobiales bacterium]
MPTCHDKHDATGGAWSVRRFGFTIEDTDRATNLRSYELDFVAVDREAVQLSAPRSAAIACVQPGGVALAAERESFTTEHGDHLSHAFATAGHRAHHG